MMELVYPKEKLFLRKKKSKKANSGVFVFIYLQLINIIAGPDIILKFLGYKYNDVAEIGFGWFTTSVNLIFILLAIFVLLNNRLRSFKLISKAKNIVFILTLISFSCFLVLDNMFDQSLNSIILTFGYFIKICSLIILFQKYDIEFLPILLRVLKILILLMLVYLAVFFSNGFSTTLIGRYQGIFNQPNSLGQFSSLTIASLFSDRLYFVKKHVRINNTLSFIFFLFVAIAFVIMSQSFTNLLLIMLIVLMYFFYTLRHNMLKVLLCISIILFIFSFLQILKISPFYHFQMAR